ncbi:hypothetical protein TI39_contig5855g00003 [Zymoseptoria brevis]|uniref:Enoyl reductase (ER) domain-containing protein n=1 Tax=Zymoseptoria brevis TaxID=1047168 RepID=A0A0F4G853_9PEZI|nr:hypothetical protein TI39_contig5855g00003 [Zymoseptoria brevis]
MKEAVVSIGPKVTIRDSDIPKPEPRQVIIKTVFAGCNPKDWKMAEWMPQMQDVNQGDDIAGHVHEVGSEVTEFKKGDRVAAFHQMLQPGGGWAEYSVAWEHTTFFLPDKTSFEEGAAIPLAALTAAIGLFASDRLALPNVFTPATEPIPLVVYGASSAVGSYVLQFAAKANIHPLICISGRAQDHVEKLIDRSKGDTIIDYRKGDEAVVEGIKSALKGSKLDYAYDAVSEKGSFQNICKVLEPNGKITLVLPSADYSDIPEGVQQSQTNVGQSHDQQKDLAFVYSRLITRGLQEGWFKAQPQEVIPGGLGGVQTGLERLKDGTASAIKHSSFGNSTELSFLWFISLIQRATVDLITTSTVLCHSADICIPHGEQTLIRARKLPVSIALTDDNLPLLDLSPNEEEIFSTWEPDNIYCGIVSSPALPVNVSLVNIASGAVPENYTVFSTPPFVVRYQYSGDNNFRVLATGTETYTEELARQLIVDTYERITKDARGDGPLDQLDVKAFSGHRTTSFHVPEIKVRAGFYGDLTALQGGRSTWFRGRAWGGQYSTTLWGFIDQWLLPHLVADLETGP